MKLSENLLIFAVLFSCSQWFSTKTADLFDEITSGELVLPTSDQHLLTAIENNDAKAVKFWLAEGANPNTNTRVLNDQFDLVVNPILIDAVQTGNPEIVNLLLAAGADPEQPNEDGRTALMIARENGYDEIANLLQTFRDKSSEPDRENTPKLIDDKFRARATYRAHVQKRHGKLLEVTAVDVA